MTPRRIFSEHATAVSYFKVALVTLPLILLVVLANNERIDAARRHSDKQNAALAKSLTEKLDAKFSRANAIANFSVNHEVCTLRTIANAQIKRLELTKSKGYKEAEVFWATIRSNQFTIPLDLKCSTLSVLPPR